ncbi:MAG TPA: GIY-YIG nuclease family protein [Anaerolineae bacterium]|nr:GIY-YIG nuclease family protein [Anaerolineae bacterium]
MPFVYIVECVDGSLYTGWAVDVSKRVAAHNAGRGARYTRLHSPVKLVYVEECESRGAALKRELAIKRLPRVKKLALAQPPVTRKKKNVKRKQVAGSR